MLINEDGTLTEVGRYDIVVDGNDWSTTAAAATTLLTEQELEDLYAVPLSTIIVGAASTIIVGAPLFRSHKFSSRRRPSSAGKSVVHVLPDGWRYIGWTS
jgi:hypothetical protein